MFRACFHGRFAGPPVIAVLCEDEPLPVVGVACVLFVFSLGATVVLVTRHFLSKISSSVFHGFWIV